MPQLDRRRSNPDPANVIGARVRSIRLERELSQTECAALLQKEINARFPDVTFILDQSDLSRIEGGRRPVFDYELRALAQVLAVSSDYLLGLVDERGAVLGAPEDED